jgi:hypothetical protein
MGGAQGCREGEGLSLEFAEMTRKSDLGQSKMGREYFGVSVVIELVPTEGGLKGVWAWESVFLISSAARSRARREAIRLAKLELPRGMRPIEFRGALVRPRFAGIRRIVRSSETWETVLQGRVNGLDVTFVTLRFESRKQFESYVTGHPARVTIED